MCNYVYIITTDNYLNEKIYKVGCSSNIERRLKQFNSTRIQSDFFRIVYLFPTVNMYALEARIHSLLANDRLNNEFFKIQNVDSLINLITNTELSILDRHLTFSIFYYRQNPVYSFDEIKNFVISQSKFNLARFCSKQHWCNLFTLLNKYQPDLTESFKKLTIK